MLLVLTRELRPVLLRVSRVLFSAALVLVAHIPTVTWRACTCCRRKSAFGCGGVPGSSTFIAAAVPLPRISAAAGMPPPLLGLPFVGEAARTRVQVFDFLDLGRRLCQQAVCVCVLLVCVCVCITICVAVKHPPHTHAHTC